jgi:regulatory protein
MIPASQDEYKRTFGHAVKLLNLRMHTTQELRRKLLLRKYNKTYIEQVLARLAELKVLDDARFAEVFLDNLIRYKTYGFYGLKMKLLQRGISSTLAERLLSEQLDLAAETKIAQRLIAKKSADPDKLAGMLRRKGFRSEVIYKLTQK